MYTIFHDNTCTGIVKDSAAANRSALKQLQEEHPKHAPPPSLMRREGRWWRVPVCVAKSCSSSSRPSTIMHACDHVLSMVDSDAHGYSLSFSVDSLRMWIDFARVLACLALSFLVVATGFEPEFSDQMCPQNVETTDTGTKESRSVSCTVL
jgi:hypothetical protein